MRNGIRHATAAYRVPPVRRPHRLPRQRPVEELRARSHEITDEHLRHLSPLGWEHIALTGVYRWDLGRASGIGRLRPLRS